MSRKYGQKGYDEANTRERRPPAPQGPRPKLDGPKGKGLGAVRTEVFRCRACGTARAIAEPLGPETVCSQCGKALHACVNCVSFDPSARFECRKAVPKPVLSKTKANECGLFGPRIVQEFESDARKDLDARAAFDALFKM